MGRPRQRARALPKVADDQQLINTDRSLTIQLELDIVCAEIEALTRMAGMAQYDEKKKLELAKAHLTPKQFQRLKSLWKQADEISKMERFFRVEPIPGIARAVGDEDLAFLVLGSSGTFARQRGETLRAVELDSL